MTLNPISRALASGHTATRVISFLQRTFPQLKGQIDQARSKGSSDDQIASYLAKSMNEGRQRQYVTPEQIAEGKRQKKSDEGKKTLGTLAKIGLTASSLALMPQLSNLARGLGAAGVQGAIGQMFGGGPQPPQGPVPQGPVPQGGPQTPPIPPGTPPLQPNQPPQAPPTPQIPPPQSPLPQEPPPQEPLPKEEAPIQEELPQEDDLSILMSHPVGAPFQALARENTPDVIAGTLKKLHLKPSDVKDFESKAGKPFEQIVTNAYSQLKQSQPEEAVPEVSPPVEEATPSEAIAPEETLEETEEPLDSGSRVFLPSGAEGSILEVKRDHAIVDVNGRKKKVPLDDLQQVDESFLEATKNLIDQIPEEERSAPLAFGSFVSDMVIGDKKVPAMLVQVHEGSQYLFPGATEKDFDAIFGKRHSAKTTGENAWHAWEAGKESRGAGFAVIKKQLEEKFGKIYEIFPPKLDTFKRIRYAQKILSQRLKKEKKRLSKA